jgi:uncharacterized protein
MKSLVYFSDLRSRNKSANKISKITSLFDEARFEDIIKKDDLTAVKLHFGEEGNDTFLNPIFIRSIVDKIKEIGAKPFLTDTNTLYFGTRHNSVSHILTAVKHGFDYSVTDAPIIIADGLFGEYYENVKIDLKHFNMVKIAGDIINADSMLVMSHFKGHGMSGFGGAIKNLAMGCAAAAGKIEQHECVKPIISDLCVGCGTCMENCPTIAMTLDQDRVLIDFDICIGCNNCMEICPDSAVRLDIENIEPFIEKMTEYAYGSIKNKKNKVGYINFLMNITPDCDCLPYSDAPIVPDIGILASKDPVALDTASYDLVNKQFGFKNSKLEKNFHEGDDKFMGVWKEIDGGIQLRYGEEIGLGTMFYDLVKID